ncbi:MAG TPA: hypothetical protein VLH38_03970 [Patescibacteria group bacterium]|nr:hypothetical protein [Patescibacteria group bacterium]
MHFLRKVAVAAAATLLTITLFSLGLAWSGHQVFGTSNAIKHALSKSGIYQSAVTEILHKQQGTDNSGSNLPVDQPQIKQIIEDAFPPQFLQSQVEQVINAVYAWLNGKTPSLQFSVDLGPAKLKLADGVEQYVISHLATLPPCAANAIPSGDIDPLNTTCAPPGLDVRAVAAKERENILRGDFLKDSTLSADSIKDKDGKTLNQRLQEAPKNYRRVMLVFYGSGLLALVVGAVIVFGSTTWRLGLRRVAIILITIGTMGVALGFISSLAVHYTSTKIASAQASDKVLQQQLLSIIRSLTDNLRTWWIIYGVALLALGIAALLTLHLTAHEKRAKTEPGTAGESDGKTAEQKDKLPRNSKE